MGANAFEKFKKKENHGQAEWVSEFAEGDRELIFDRLRNVLGEIRDAVLSDTYGIEEDIRQEREVVSCFQELRRFAYESFSQKDYAGVIDIGRQALEAYGVEGAETASVHSPTAAVAIAEAVNCAAKEMSFYFYKLKPLLIVSAWKLGAEFGVGANDNAYYLGTHTIGVASFHDPGDEIGHLVLNVLKERIPVWEDGWSGVSRHEDALLILRDLDLGEGLVNLYAETTSTEDMRRARKAYITHRSTVLREALTSFLSRKNLTGHPRFSPAASYENPADYPDAVWRQLNDNLEAEYALRKERLHARQKQKRGSMLQNSGEQYDLDERENADREELERWYLEEKDKLAMQHKQILDPINKKPKRDR
jgi:hypothetical protein